MRLMKLVLALMSAISATACGGLSPVASVSGLPGILGDDLTTARGRTCDDQKKIDKTLEKGITVGIWTRPKAEVPPCDRKQGA